MRLSFNSNFLCACQNETIDSCDKSTRDKLDLCKLSLKEHDELYNNDIDQHLTLQSNFNYYELHDFHKLSAKNIRQNSHGFHSNIASIINKQDNLELLLQSLDFKFDVIALSETWHYRKMMIFLQSYCVILRYCDVSAILAF